MKGLIAISRLILLLALAVTAVLVSVSQRAGGSPPLSGRRIAIAAQRAGSSPPLNSPVLSVEGCLKCHDQIEPMHRYGPTVAGALDKLDNGKDGVGLTCTACHGGNPVAITKEEAHVQPRFPKEWIRQG